MPTAVHDPHVTAARPRLWRITDRRSFVELRRRGRRVRRGPVTLTFLPPDAGAPTPPRAGFAIGRATGGAVVRNRVRRRLRAALHQLLVEDRLPAGTYLLGAQAEVATMPWSALVSQVADAVAEATS